MEFPLHRRTWEGSKISLGIRSTELNVTIVGLQNAGKTSLLRVLSVGPTFLPESTVFHANRKRYKGGEFTDRYVNSK